MTPLYKVFSYKRMQVAFTFLFLALLLYTLYVKFQIDDLLIDLSYLEIERKYSFLLLAITLLVLNWSLEAQKWKLAMNEFVQMDFSTSIKSVLTGVTVGLFTPAKLGEYAGRMLLVKQEERAASAIATLLNSMAQMLVTIVVGLFGAIAFADKLNYVDIDMSKIYVGGLLGLVGIMGVFVMLPELIKYLSRFSFLGRYLINLQELKVSKRVLFSILALAAIRYAVYATQYICIFYFLAMEYCIVEFAGYISLVFFIQSLMPLPPIAAFIGRGGIALLVFSTLGINELVILYATLLIWIINLLIPSLCGLGIIMKHKTQSIT